ncbi:MAG: DUF720 domain-containing protein [bacterium]|jgi:hypothetical protein|nr:DUF720 domain-containing protein [bacterium]
MKKGKIIIAVLFLLATNTYLFSQPSGSIWVKTFKPGSANYEDETIDPVALAIVDSLMKLDDIEVIFLGGADQLKWKALPELPQLSTAIDQAKKFERASKLRERYGRGEIGITDEPIRGVKVVWSPKKPDPFKMNEIILQLKSAQDSLVNLVMNLNQQQTERFAAIQDSIIKERARPEIIVEHNSTNSNFDWEIKTGILAWFGGGAYDLSVPCFGISLQRQFWAFEIEGGFTPWSRPAVSGNRGDALIMGTITMFPQKFFEVKVGAFSGWEFLSKTDQWTMKIMGLTTGPTLKWKFIEGYLGYSISKLSTLTQSDRWVSGLMLNCNFKFLVN